VVIINSKERLVKVLNNETPDQIPWSSLVNKYFLASLEKKYGKIDPLDFLLEIGADAIPWISFKTKSKNVEVTTYINGKKVKEVNNNWFGEIFDYIELDSFRGSNNCVIDKEYIGFGGILTSSYIYKAEADTVFLKDFMIKGIKDYKIFKKMIMDLEYLDIHNDYKNALEKINGKGLPFIGLPGSPMIELMEFFMGAERFLYSLTDNKREIEDLLDAMRAKYIKCYKFYSNLECEAIISIEDAGAIFYSPQMFNHYIKPVLSDYRDIIKSSGKIHIIHSCGHLKNIIPMLKEIEPDCLESVSPPPIGSIEIDEIQKQLPGICIMGGIPAHVFRYSLADFKEYIKSLILKVKGKGNFILSSGDSTPADAKIENLKAIPDLIRKYGKY